MDGEIANGEAVSNEPLKGLHVILACEPQTSETAMGLMNQGFSREFIQLNFSVIDQLKAVLEQHGVCVYTPDDISDFLVRREQYGQVVYDLRSDIHACICVETLPNLSAGYYAIIARGGREQERNPLLAKPVLVLCHKQTPKPVEQRDRKAVYFNSAEEAGKKVLDFLHNVVIIGRM